MIGGVGLRGLLRCVVSASVAMSLVLSSTPARACTQIYFGSEVTADGSVIIGRSEDYAARYPKQFGVEPQDFGKVYWSGENGSVQDAAVNFTRTAPGETYRYTYVRDLPAYWEGAPKPYAEAGVNEKGVSVDGTVTLRGNDAVASVDPLVANGLGEYCIIDVVLSEASSAREGVELLGQVIDEQGSQQSAALIIADTDETWRFWQLSGHQWLGVRLPNSVVGIDPNMERLVCAIDLGDEDGCLHSEGLVEVAETAGTLVRKGNVIDIGKSYFLQERESDGYTRYAQARLAMGAALEPDISYKLDESGDIKSMRDAPLFFVPPRSDYDIADAMRVLRTRGEGTQFDSGVNAGIYPVANPGVTECHLFVVRPDLDSQIATVEWLALSNGEFSLYVPCYAALVTRVDPVLYPEADAFDLGHAAEVVNEDAAVMAALQSGTDHALDYVLMDINILAQAHREQVGAGVHAYLDTLQSEVIAQQAEVDLQLQTSVDEVDRSEFANEAHDRISHQAYDHCVALLEDLRAYLQAGDLAEQYVPSGLTEAGQLVEPLTYASEMLSFGKVVEPAEDETQPHGSTPEDDASAEEPTSGPAQWLRKLPRLLAYVLAGVGIIAEVAAALALRKMRRG